MPKPFFLLLLLLFASHEGLYAQPAPPEDRTGTAPLSDRSAMHVVPSSADAAATAMSPASPVLDNYIRIGLDSNLALHQRNFDLERAQLDLKRARSQFYPQATFSSQYTLADGGRSQEVPIGDLLNGVYSTLNKLTGSQQFPQVANQSIQFLPNNFQDTKMEVSLPILNTDLLHNKEVNAAGIAVSRADRDVYRRDLVRNIRQAYYQYLQAARAVAIYNTALALVTENRRVSQKFVENQMATREIVLRAQAQVSQVESSLIEAGNQQRNAAAYFNFLLNRPLEDPVTADSALMEGSVPGTEHPSSKAISNREEFNRLGGYRQMLASDLHWDRAYLIPKLSAFYDVGYQGFGFHFNNTQFYQLAGVQLVWSIFRAGGNRYKIRQDAIQMQSVADQYRLLTEQLTLEQQTAVNNYNSALDALRSLDDEVTSARETYRLAERRFDEGQALQIELIDARSQMTSAELRYSLGRLAVLDRAADLERINAAYRFKD
jgi:outer membrane protein TolC